MGRNFKVNDEVCLKSDPETKLSVLGAQEIVKVVTKLTVVNSNSDGREDDRLVVDQNDVDIYVVLKCQKCGENIPQHFIDRRRNGEELMYQCQSCEELIKL